MEIDKSIEIKVNEILEHFKGSTLKESEKILRKVKDRLYEDSVFN